MLNNRKLYLEYYDEKRLTQFPFNQSVEKPHFNLYAGDSVDEDGEAYGIIAKPNNVLGLALKILDYLRKPESSNHTYHFSLDDAASQQLGAGGRLVLEGILALHNNIIAPRK
ncbi:MAG: hypothetical protein AABW48_00705 [Nanoarchaeota archaeon]